MTDLELIKNSLENSLELIEQKMTKSSFLIGHADMLSKYIPFIEGGGYGYSESKKKEELKRLRDDITTSIIKALKITDLFIPEINTCTNILKNNKKAYWFSSLINRVIEMERKLNEQIYYAKNLKDKFANQNIDFKNIVLEENEYAIEDYNIIKMGINFNDFHFKYFEYLTKIYGKADKSNIEIIHNEYTQRCSSFDLNRKLRKGQILDEKEKRIRDSINSVCNNNKLEENIYLFRYVSQEFINKYNIEFDRLSQSSVSNAIYKFKKNVINEKIKEKEGGFISSSCELKKNVFNPYFFSSNFF